MSHTYAILDISRAAFDEIAAKLRAAGYDQAFDRDVIDMHGIAVRIDEHATQSADRVLELARWQALESHIGQLNGRGGAHLPHTHQDFKRCEAPDCALVRSMRIVENVQENAEDRPPHGDRPA